MLALRRVDSRQQRFASSTPVFSRVVAGIDFSPPSLAAARWAFPHGPSEGHAILSHVVPDSDAAPDLEHGLRGFGATLDVVSARVEVRSGRPSHWLNVIASDADASLLVLGRRADANRRRIGEPSVLERLARRTRASVLVVPEGTAAPLQHVIVAIDRSVAAEQALITAAELARAHDYALSVVHVLPPELGEYQRLIARDRSTTQAIPLTAASRDARRWMDDIRARLLPSNAVVTLAIGDPAREIVNTALASSAAMIVIGKRGDDESPVGSLGSVARELLTAAPVPVLAVDDVGDI
jgi:nucleotide-binding universal stress UspA family protein